MWTDNPIKDYDFWESEELKKYNKNVRNAPTCECCGKSVLDFDYVYDFGGEIICEDCITTYRVDTDKWWEL